MKQACTIDEYLHIKNFSCKKCLVAKLILACEDEILNTIGNSLDSKKVTCEKNSHFIHTIFLIIICWVLLVAISISCYFYYSKYQPKQKYLFISQQGIDISNII